MSVAKENEIRMEFETPQFLHGLFANEPKELNYVLEKLGVTVITREGWMLLKGDQDAVEQAKQAFIDLEEALKAVTGSVSTKCRISIPPRFHLGVFSFGF